MNRTLIWLQHKVEIFIIPTPWYEENVISLLLKLISLLYQASWKIYQATVYVSIRTLLFYYCIFSHTNTNNNWALFSHDHFLCGLTSIQSLHSILLFQAEAYLKLITLFASIWFLNIDNVGSVFILFIIFFAYTFYHCCMVAAL